MVASVITGLLLSLYFQEVGLVFLLCFAAGSLVTTAFVNIRGIFLTVSSVPLLFAAGLLGTAWAVGRSQASEGAPILSRATALTTVFPLTQYFPWLAVVTVLAVALGLLRLWLVRRKLRRLARNSEEIRVRTAEAERRNQDLSASARRRVARSGHPSTGQITVEELLARDREGRRNNR